MRFNNWLIGMLICVITVIASFFIIFGERAEAGIGCGIWDGIPTITMRTTDKKLTYEQSLKDKEITTSGMFITLGITDVGKYHGDVCAGISFGYRACQIAFARLYPGEIPLRGDQFVVMNPERSCPTDAISYITGTRYGKGAPATGIRNKNLVFDSTLPRFSFIFTSMSAGKSVKIVGRFALPKDFMELQKITFAHKATAEEEEKFFHMVRCLSLHILTAPEHEIFEVEPLRDFSWKKFAEKETPAKKKED